MEMCGAEIIKNMIRRLIGVANGKSCDTCASWDPIQTRETLGRCRKLPPVANKQPNRAATGEWPTTSDQDWCDEYIWKGRNT